MLPISVLDDIGVVLPDSVLDVIGVVLPISVLDGIGVAEICSYTNPMLFSKAL